MRKIVGVLVVLFILALSLGVSAEGMDFVGGVTYNSFVGESSVILDLGEVVLERNTLLDGYDGCGFFAGLRYWFSDKFAVGGGYDLATWHYVDRYEFLVDGEYDEFDEDGRDAQLAGVYGELVYQVTPYLSLSGAVASYDYVVTDYDKDYDYEGEEIYVDDEYTRLRGDGLGYLIGAEFSYPVTEKLTLKTKADYRKVDLNIDEFEEEPTDHFDSCTLDLTGYRFSAGLSYAF